MVALVGSAKQIAWATDIRADFPGITARFFENCAAAYGHRDADDKGRAYQLNLFATGQLLVEEMEVETSAARWIEARGDFKNAIVRRLFNAANRAAAAARVAEIADMVAAIVALTQTVVTTPETTPEPPTSGSKTRRNWTAAEKSAIVAAYESARNGSKWAVLADAGISRNYIYRWRKQLAGHTIQRQAVAA